MSVLLIQGDARNIPLADKSIHCCVTSPPYWGLRDYGVEGQLGLEKTPEEYIRSMVEVFREVKRVLRDDGTLWLNMGDSYCSQPNQRVQKANGRDDVAGWKQSTNIGSLTQGSSYVPGLKPKDLIGIPWMLAFALRQPYEDVKIKDRADRAWMAALTDGEGCLTILRAQSPHGSGDSFPPILQIRMCDPECIKRAQQITGFVETVARQYPPSQGGVRGAYQWRIHGERAAQIAAEIYPHLCIKRKQAVVLWNHQQVRDSYETKRGVCIPEEALEKQKQCRDLIRCLNHHKPVDLPSWMKEPKINVEPGWYLRSDVIWSKPNPMPESVTDRPTKAHEYIFLLSKSEKYYYDADAILEPVSLNTHMRLAQDVAAQIGSERANGGAKTNGNMKAVSRRPKAWDVDMGSNRTLVAGHPRKIRSKESWNGAKFDDARDLEIRPNTGRKRSEAGSGIKYNDSFDAAVCLPVNERNKRTVWTVNVQGFAEAHFATFPEELIKPCILAGTPEGGTVLDPFMGSGTTALVAQNLQCNAVGIELNPAYLEIAKRRLAQSVLSFTA